jgi:hypothetical protein
MEIKIYSTAKNSISTIEISETATLQDVIREITNKGLAVGTFNAKNGGFTMFISDPINVQVTEGTPVSFLDSTDGRMVILSATEMKGGWDDWSDEEDEEEIEEDEDSDDEDMEEEEEIAPVTKEEILTALQVLQQCIGIQENETRKLKNQAKEIEDLVNQLELSSAPVVVEEVNEDMKRAILAKRKLSLPITSAESAYARKFNF